MTIRKKQQDWMLPLGATCIGLFLLTSLLLHCTLESVEDGNLLSSSHDWKRIRPPRAKVLAHPLLDVHKYFQGDSAFARSTWQRSTGVSSRRAFEALYPPDDWERINKNVNGLRKTLPGPPQDASMTYDIYNCPDQPPPSYPANWLLVSQVLTHWPVDETDIPSDNLHQGLCVFSVEDMPKVQAYRRAEVPFVLQGHAEVLRTAERWSHDGYLQDLLGNEPQRNEYSENHHFMFWRLRGGSRRGVPDKWTPPTKNVELTYPDWLEKAVRLQESEIAHVNQEHWYFRLNAAHHQLNDFLYEEFPIFEPDEVNSDTSLFMVEQSQQRGINCRFGMKGVVAEAHFDPTRNWITILSGQRRYILAHPDQCQHLELYPPNHPSGRHSKVNWSDPPATGPITKARVTEVVLQAGDALYLPTSYFHFIVSLNINFQCNARSGMTQENMHFFDECGFAMK